MSFIIIIYAIMSNNLRNLGLIILRSELNFTLFLHTVKCVKAVIYDNRAHFAGREKEKERR